jgi:hypothetical protein
MISLSMHNTGDVMFRIACLVLSIFSTQFALAQEKATVEPYGFIKLDSAYDTRGSENGDYMKWVSPSSNNNPQFNMTGNQTRLGIKIKAFDSKEVEVSGQVEADLYSLQGGAAEEYKPGAQFRHFFLKAKFVDSGITLLAGQTSDVISPLNADTVNYSVLWWAGNLGYRRPQIRLTKDFQLTQTSALKVEVAAVRVIGHSAESSSSPVALSSTSATGTQSEAPGVQGRVSYSRPILTEKAMEIGLGAAYGNEVDGTNKNLQQSAVAVDLYFPILSNLVFKGEVYSGKNLDTLNGGIGQGVLKDTTQIRSVGAEGGWAELAYDYSDRWNFNIGAGSDHAHDGDLASGGRLSNTTFFGNAFYKVTKSFQAALEVSSWDTSYKGKTDTQSNRYQIAGIFNF